jgi:hypothetical protein
MLTESRQGRPEELTLAIEIRDELLQGRRPLRTTIRDLAEEHGLEDWYWGIYSLACEPAHLGDLVEFMPDGLAIEVGVSRTLALYRAIVAVHHGTTVVLAMLDEAGADRARTDAFGSRLAKISAAQIGG